MANLPNQYAVPSLPNLDPQTNRVIQDLAARVNYLTTELDRVRGVATSASPMMDAAKKENPGPGILSIPALESITDFYRDFSTVGNVGAGLDPLHSYTLLANSLALDGDSVRVRYGGNFTNNANTKRIQVTADGQVAFNSGARAFDIGGLAWRIELDYGRTSSTSLRVSGFAALGTALTSGGAFDAGNSRFYYAAFNPTTLTVANLNVNPIVLLVEGEATANNDVTQNFSAIEIFSQAGGGRGFIRISPDGTVVSYTNPS